MNAPHPHKARRGFSRLWHATGYSLQGLQAGWQEKAFRLEAQLAIVLLPAAFFLGQTWVERILLAGSVLLVLIVELLNSGIEAAIDRIGPELHPLSKKAKDLGSAAVLLSLLLVGLTWGCALLERFLP
ncbi:diacylglycerol kinase [Comamonas nitrativorans]|uniref:Diacylglycerol kinase n=1 Tax=Comamonas nitrativorans TaxID=108437 RepID=A0ABV9GXN6_9BURK